MYPPLRAEANLGYCFTPQHLVPAFALVCQREHLAQPAASDADEAVLVKENDRGRVAESDSAAAMAERGSSLRGRQFRFDVLPSDVVSLVSVVKTESADQEEGGISGNVDLRTYRPLDIGRRVTTSATRASS